MKLVRAPKENPSGFTPVAIVLETQEEIDAIRMLAGRVSGEFNIYRTATNDLHRLILPLSRLTAAQRNRNVSGLVCFTPAENINTGF